MPSPSALDVNLNGGRSYVQGWQMLAGAARELARHQGATALGSAVFRRLTARRVAWITDADSNDSATIGSAQFVSPAGPITGVFRELDAAAPHRDLPDRVTMGATTPMSPLESGQFSIAGVDDFAGLLATIIRGVKAVHAAPEIRDIWFTGQRGGLLPIAAGAVPAEGMLGVEVTRIQGRDGRFQSICPVTFSVEDRVMLRTVVTFAFRRMEVDDVA